MLRRIPSLDGLRAVSITFVVVSHLTPQYDHPAAKFALLLGGNGQLGVSIFFGISGYLITCLIAEEYHRTRKVNLVDFYIRRGFRIFPAFYCYLGTLLLLGAIGVIKVFPATWLSAACYLRNYFPPLGQTGDQLTAHAWSLAVEEQFYLLWPPCFALLGRRRAVWFAAALVALSPAVRILSYFLFPQLRSHDIFLTHNRIDALMAGCLGALLSENSQFKHVLGRVFAWRLPLLAIPFLLFAAPLLRERLGGGYQLLLGNSLECFAIVLILLWLVERPGTPLGRVLNMRLVAHVGVISYSLYLWQQLYIFKPGWWSLPATLLTAELSFWLIEKPFLRLRNRFVRAAPRVSPSAGPPLDAPSNDVHATVRQLTNGYSREARIVEAPT